MSSVARSLATGAFRTIVYGFYGALAYDWHSSSINKRRLVLMASTSIVGRPLTTRDDCLEYCKTAAQIEFDNVNPLKYALSRVASQHYTMPMAPIPVLRIGWPYYSLLTSDELKLLDQYRLLSYKSR